MAFKPAEWAHNLYNKYYNVNTNKLNNNYAGDDALMKSFNDWYAPNNYNLGILNKNADSIYKDFVNYQTDQDKNALNSYINKNFAGLGGSNLWLDNYWNNSADDEMVNNFIDTNYNNALKQLDRALKRGTLTQSGYNDALNNLNTQKSGAYTTVGSIGQSIMDQYKNDLTEKVQGFGTDVNNYTLDNRNMLNTSNFENSLNNLYNDQKNNFESQFNLMTQDLSPFDVTSIIGDARVGQGVNNTQSDQLLGAIEDNEKKKKDKVGLGNTGLF